MAGHSQFKNIMHRKGAQDKRKAKAFNKVAREITVAVKESGPDPDMNPRLRLAMLKGREVNMPNDRIKRAIELGMPGSADGVVYSEARYEGYGPGGVAIIIEALTDNRTRTVGDVRLPFTKNGGALGDTNSVSFMFEHVGEIMYPAAKGSADDMFEAAVEAGAQNVESSEDAHVVYTAIEDFAAVREALSQKFGDPEKSGLIWKPLNLSTVDFETGEKMMKLIETLEDNDDVQNVFTNMDMPDDVAARLMPAED